MNIVLKMTNLNSNVETQSYIHCVLCI